MTRNFHWFGSFALLKEGVSLKQAQTEMDAIGARITLRFASWTVMREVKSSRGTYTSADTRTLHFGLGSLGCDFTLEVRWPDGKLTTLDGNKLPSNHFLAIDYTKGLSTP